MTIMLSGPFFMLPFLFNINSVILSGFPLTSFHLAEALLSAFRGFVLLCVQLSKKYHEMSFIYIYSHF